LKLIKILTRKIKNISFFGVNKPVRNDHRIRIFPEYFDKSLPRGKGRRLPLKLALENPSLNELKIAGQKLGYEVEIDPQKAYPRTWDNPKGILYISMESAQKLERNKSKMLIDLSKTVTEYARPKIQEYMKQKERDLSAGKKQKKKVDKRDQKKHERKHKPSRRRR
jgi:signal recognition particle subunit SRP19